MPLFNLLKSIYAYAPSRLGEWDGVAMDFNRIDVSLIQEVGIIGTLGWKPSSDFGFWILDFGLALFSSACSNNILFSSLSPNQLGGVKPRIYRLGNIRRDKQHPNGNFENSEAKFRIVSGRCSSRITVPM